MGECIEISNVKALYRIAEKSCFCRNVEIKSIDSFKISIIINKKDEKDNERRVGIGSSQSESVMVEDRYEAYIEEHLRVSNRNLNGE